MLQSAKRQFWELCRCTRHNLLHLKVFRLSYQRGMWHVRHGDVDMVFPYYPYLAFHDIEGYLQQGAWRLEPGMTVLDVGGCYGDFSLYASKCVGPAGRVLCLEPDPGNIKIARRNFELNGNPTNIEIIPIGLWKHAGKLRFNAGQGPMSSIVGAGAGTDIAPAPSSESIEIDVESLASLTQRLGLKQLDFVKMDIEGAEMEVISVAGDLPAKYKPRYAIASYHIVDGSKTADLLPESFTKINYQSKSGYPGHLTTWGWPVGQPD